MFNARMKSKRLYLINRDFQLRYTKIALAVGLCSTALTVTLILLPLFQLNVLRFPNFMPFPFVAALLMASATNFFLIVWMGILITHRIAGPMHSLVRHMRLIQMGRVSGPLQVRDTDDLKYLIRNSNELFEYFISSAKRDHVALEKIIQTLKSTDNAFAINEAISAAETLQSEIEGRIKPKRGDASRLTELA